MKSSVSYQNYYINFLITTYFFIWNIKPVFDFLFNFNPILGTALYTILLFLITTVLFFSVFGNNKRIDFIWFFFFFFTFYIAVSALWGYSEEPLKDLSNIFVSFYMFTVLLISREYIYVGRKMIVEGLALSIVPLTIIMLIIGVDVDGRYGNIESFHPNVVSVYMAIAAFSASALLFGKYKRALNLCLISLSVFSLLMMKSKSTIGVLIISFALYFLIGMKIKLWKKIWYFLLFVLFISLFLYLAKDLYLPYLDEYSTLGDGKLVFTLTGRTLIWENIIFGGYLSFFGNGVNSFVYHGPQIAEITLHSAHNEFLNNSFNYGILGAFFYISFYLYVYRQVSKVRSKGISEDYMRFDSLFCFMAFSYFFSRSFVEAPVYYFNLPLEILVIIMAMRRGNESTSRT
ncbi:Lipid A core - O-antigen ligase and related enzymes [Serratia fonticola]|uniref:O-antigen ligase family protein n=1 Tax=Serratia fonticola TaxID=47917 RepID=UPI002177F0F2|nr:O-antigen ligase family protein [Serratia fonticola]CAI1766683.1 Lipid A core - O-antigen ligase and related enzymes [Serratia fonticola]